MLEETNHISEELQTIFVFRYSLKSKSQFLQQTLFCQMINLMQGKVCVFLFCGNKGHFSLIRQAWAAIDNNLFSLFWRYFALSFLLKTRQTRRIEVLKLKTNAFFWRLRTLLEVSEGFAEW